MHHNWDLSALTCVLAGAAHAGAQLRLQAGRRHYGPDSTPGRALTDAAAAAATVQQQRGNSPATGRQLRPGGFLQ